MIGNKNACTINSRKMKKEGEKMWLFDVIRKKILRRKYFGDIAEEWLNYKRISVKESTYYKYSYSINKYLKDKLYKVHIEDLETYDFNEFSRSLGTELSAKTIKEILNILKAILRYGKQKYNLKVNVDLISSPKVQAEELQILTKRERVKLETYCSQEGSLRSIGILVCLYTGMRIGEMCALKWENIDLEKKIIRIEKTLQRVYTDGKTKVIIDTPKTKSSIRKIPISKKLYKILKPLKKRHEKEDFFLTGSKDKYIEPRNYQYLFKITLKNSKIKNYKFHILRHTFATNCIEVGMDIKSLSEILGHSNTNVTMNRYVHSSYNRKKQFLEKL